MTNLADPDTELDQFFLQIGRASAQAAPVARTQALLFTDMADTFAASPPTRARSRRRSRRPRRRWTPRSPRSGSSSRSTWTSRTCPHGCAPPPPELPRSLPAINSAFKVGTPVLPRTVELNENLEKALGEAKDLFENPNTLLALKDLDTALTVSPRRSSSSPRTRRSATTSTTSCTRSARRSPSYRRARRAAAPR